MKLPEFSGCFFGCKTLPAYFCTHHDHNEAYKTHSKTFLREVCSVMCVTT